MIPQRGIFVAAYATSPGTAWDSAVDSDYFGALLRDPRVAGLEHPYLDEPARYPASWVREMLGESRCLLVTLLPATMQRAVAEPGFGLASYSEGLRSQAVRLAARAHSFVRSFDAFSGTVVKAVHLHSAPRNDAVATCGSAAAFHRSLREILDMGWGRVALNVEHCDAYVPGQLPEKGYLSLDEEIGVLRELQHVGLVVNWGRSAIEARSAAGALGHLARTRSAGLLRGLFFSGCTDHPNSPYGAWRDTHMPPRPYPGSRHLAEESLLGDAEIGDALAEAQACDAPVYLGAKVLDPARPGSLERSLGLNLETVSAVRRVLESLRGRQSVRRLEGAA